MICVLTCISLIAITGSLTWPLNYFFTLNRMWSVYSPVFPWLRSLGPWPVGELLLYTEYNVNWVLTCISLIAITGSLTWPLTCGGITVYSPVFPWLRSLGPWLDPWPVGELLLYTEYNVNWVLTCISLTAITGSLTRSLFTLNTMWIEYSPVFPWLRSLGPWLGPWPVGELLLWSCWAYNESTTNITKTNS